MLAHQYINIVISLFIHTTWISQELIFVDMSGAKRRPRVSVVHGTFTSAFEIFLDALGKKKKIKPK